MLGGDLQVRQDGQNPHHAARNIGIAHVRSQHGQDLVDQLGHLIGAHILDRVQQGHQHIALTIGTAKVAVNIADTGVSQSLFRGQEIRTCLQSAAHVLGLPCRRRS